METILYNRIIAKAKTIGGDYNELRSDYCSAICSLKTNENILKVFHWESLLKEKNRIECTYALKKGFDSQKKDVHMEKSNWHYELFENGFDDTTYIRALYESAEYRKLEDEIRTAQDDVFSAFENDTETIDKLCEVYSDYNYELVSAAYIIGFEIKQYCKLVRETHI